MTDEPTDTLEQALVRIKNAYAELCQAQKTIEELALVDRIPHATYMRAQNACETAKQACLRAVEAL